MLFMKKGDRIHEVIDQGYLALDMFVNMFRTSMYSTECGGWTGRFGLEFTVDIGSHPSI